MAQMLGKETNIKSKYLEYEILKTDAFISAVCTCQDCRSVHIFVVNRLN